MTDHTRSKKAAGAVAFLATLGVSTTGPLIAGAQTAPPVEGTFAGAIPSLTAQEDAAIDAFYASYDSIDIAVANAFALGHVWDLEDVTETKVKAGLLIKAISPLPVLGDLDFFLGHDYNYVDALALSWVWDGGGNVEAGNAQSAKAKAALNLRSGFSLPLPNFVDYYSGAGYDFDDAEALGDIWGQTPGDAKLTIGEKLKAGIELTINPASEPNLFSAPSVEVVDSATAFRFGATTGVDFACTDDVLLESCTAMIDGQPYASGAALAASASTPSTMFVTAVDAAGKVTVEQVAITKDWKIEGPYAEASGTEGMIVRFYIATFSRLPDEGGFNFWNTMLTDDPTALPTVTDFFTSSPEFNLLYGENATDEQFLDAIYTNVLGRQPEASGRAFWAGALADGSHTRATTMEFFAQSPELKGLTKTS